MPSAADVLSQLYATIEARRSADPKASYVASLYAKGVDGIAKKVGEEAAEAIIAAKNPDDAALVYELADLWFHSLVLLAQRGLPLERLTDELARRSGTSGHAEKAARAGH
ncbi:phosphoribosyl-ATP diphosphatase [Solimonas soli]|uniref:phosphoribosyl-ATP diphosphatase n=1 Tax=Solimonas soli TaxID=413479 RepID=UPI0004884B63|nr:phosphoribosyl-ATP diphosphatase [Solimonas soli]